jgi:hypothetical protein
MSENTVSTAVPGAPVAVVALLRIEFVAPSSPPLLDSSRTCSQVQSIITALPQFLQLKRMCAVQCWPTERYVSSKQHRVQDDAPDRFYDVSPSCKVILLPYLGRFELYGKPLTPVWNCSSQ